MRLSTWREILNDSQKKIIIWDISGIYGIWNIPIDFLYALSLRAILWWWDINKEIIIPNASDNIQAKLYEIKNNLLTVLSIPKKNLVIGDFRKVSNSVEREPYMKTPYYFDESYLTKNIKKLELVRNFWDKVFLANFIKNNWLEYLLPKNTYTYLLWDNLIKVKKEALNRFKNKQSFIIKAGEWASGENMILVFFEKNKIYVAHSKTYWKKEIKNVEEFKLELEIAIPHNQIYKKWKFDINGYDENALLEQYFLIQDLIDTNKFEEKSINFFISENWIYPVTYGSNIANWWVHQWNIEEIIPKWLFNKFEPLLKKIKEEGYVWPIGFDFFYDKNSNDIKIIEANTRYTAPITPTMLVYKLEKQWKIPKNWTWRLLQKFPSKIDLLKVNELKEFDLVYSIIKQEDIKTPKFLVYAPHSWNYQSIIIIWPNQEEIDNLYNHINLIIKNKK